MGKTQSTLFSLKKEKPKGNPVNFKSKPKILQRSCNLKRPSAHSDRRGVLYRTLRLWGWVIKSSSPRTATRIPGVSRLQRTLFRPCSPDLLTLTLLWCIRDGWHLTLLVLQQPVQRFTSTQGGHIKKLAEVGSIWLRGISYITVRVLQTAGMASSANTRGVTPPGEHPETLLTPFMSGTLGGRVEMMFSVWVPPAHH